MSVRQFPGAPSWPSLKRFAEEPGFPENTPETACVSSFREGSLWSVLVAGERMVPVCDFDFLAERVSSYKVRNLTSHPLCVLKN